MSSAGYGEHALPARVPTLHNTVALRSLGQWQQVADYRPQGALGQERGQQPGPLAVAADEHAVEGDVGVEQRVEVEASAGRNCSAPPNSLTTIAFTAAPSSGLADVYSRTSRRSWGKTFETLPRR